MTEMDEAAYCKWFIHHLNHDKIYAEERMRHSEIWRAFAEFVFKHVGLYYYPLDTSDEWREMIEFVDGNGFVIMHKEKLSDNTFGVTIGAI